MSFKLEFKEDINLSDLAILTPKMGLLLIAVMQYCEQKNLQCKITSLKSDRKNIKSISSTHESGRAADLSTRNWSKFEIDEFVFHFNTYFRNMGAISYSDGKPRAAVYHDAGHGAHIHLQVSP